jgi:hypothetical protein
MITKKFGILILCMLFLAAFLISCGSSSKEGSDVRGPALLGGVAAVGDTPCFQCHASNADPLTGETFVAQYQRSTHADLGCESCHGGGAQHFGVGPIPYPHPDAARCAQCHNGQTEFMGKLAPLSSSVHFVNGNHGNPFSAEEAHEARCSRCHSHEGAVLMGTAGFTGDRTIMTNADFQPVLARNPATFNTMKCETCHEHGGNLRQWSTRDAGGNIVAWNPPHPNTLTKNFISDQIDLCTGCHTMTTNDGVLIGSGNTLNINGTSVPTVPFFHNTAWYRILPSTHYDQPASSTVIEGYNIRNVSENVKNPCFDCHGHEFKTNTRALVNRPERGTTIFTDWSQSAHAGHLMDQKLAAQAGVTGAAQVDAVMMAGATEETGAAWVHYDWSGDNRRACQRCHTSTGASNFLSNPAGYNAENNNFSHLAGWGGSGGTRTSNQREMLYCWGCHSNAGTGELRNPGALTFTYTNNAIASYPDISSSNVCLACHTGRETGDSIKNSTANFSNVAFINSHYLSAGGTVFAKTGYTYEGRDYSIPASDMHDKLGLGTAVATGDPNYDAVRGNYTSGPCATCHFGSVNGSHTLSPFTQYSATDKALNPVCVNCHTARGEGSNAAITWLGDDATAATLQGTTHKARYQAALEALRVQLAASGFHFFESHPYFFVAPVTEGFTPAAVRNWITGTDPTGKLNMGAAFNYNLLKHDPGGVAHNRRYTRRLIYDSIDFMDDGILNYSVFSTLNALDSSTAVYKSSAIAYLINRGTNDANIGTPAERF